MKRYDASFTVETALVMPVIFICMAVTISTAYSQRRTVAGDFAAHLESIREAHREEIFGDDRDGAGYESRFKGSKTIITEVYDPEGYMRMMTIWEGIKEKRGKTDDSGK